jgi:hypothetical protein
MARLRRISLALKFALSPQSDFGKLLRDASVMFVATILGYIIDNWSGIVANINDALGVEVPAVLLAGFYAMALYAMRKLRARL